MIQTNKQTNIHTRFLNGNQGPVYLSTKYNTYVIM